MAVAPTVAERSLQVRGTTYAVRLPSRADPRLHLAATITTIQVLGQVSLGWELSIAQILVCLLTCAVLETALVVWQHRVIAWPASALLTGNGVALVLRVNGTEHGDWWSLNGWHIFAATSALALLSKHVIRFRGRPVVNPSNLGVVVCFVVLGTDLVNPLDFWWGPMSPGMVAVYLVLAAGAVFVTHRLRLLAMSLAFWAVLAACLGLLAVSGHCISARWSVIPVCGADFWWVVVTSPEVLVFMFFMITDPMTSPRGAGARIAFGATVGLASGLLVAPMQTEFGAKVGLLAGLVLVCAARPALAVLVSRLEGSVRVAPADTCSGARADTLSYTWGQNRFGRRRERVAAAIALSGIATAGLYLLGDRARHPVLAGSAVLDSSVLAARPDVEVAGPLPAVAVSAEVETVIGNSASREAARMAAHLAEDLAIEATALEERDPALAATAVAGPRLEAARELIAAGVEQSSYSFEALTVVMVRDPRDPQAMPRYGIHATGSREAGGSTTALDRVFVLEQVAGVWLLTDALVPGPT